MKRLVGLALLAFVMFATLGLATETGQAKAGGQTDTITVTVTGSTVEVAGCGFKGQVYSAIARVPGTDDVAGGFSFVSGTGCIDASFDLPPGSYDVYVIHADGNSWVPPHIEHPVSNVVRIAIT